MAFELLSFGALSSIYHNLTEINQKVIAGTFKMQPKAFKSWIRSLSFVRNVCAHHQRLWNRNFPFNPSLSGFEKHFYIGNGQQQDIDKFYVRAAILQMLMKTISPDSKWGDSLKKIIEDHATVSIVDMGFPIDWEKRTFWNNK
jgi:abortive infection bacteriophage resistance protein